MILKSNLNKLKKIVVYIDAGKQRFANGQKSSRLVVYDATPDEVFKVVQKALENQQ